MAETSGFFQAMWDDSLTNPVTKENTGWWDRSYLAKEFMEYFALFIGNGVFASPVNQLMVIPGVGRTVIVSTGWAFINGGWYHNDSELSLELAANGSSTNRVDSVRIRFSAADRKISAVVLNGETGVTRGDTIWDLEIAQVITTPGFTTVSAANISDMRPNGNVCGFVTGLLEVVSAEGLFAQFQAIFDEWFNTVKDQVTGDLAIRLQSEFDELNQAVLNYQKSVEQEVSVFENTINQQQTNFKELITNQENEFKQVVNTQVEQIQKTATDAYNTMNNFVANDFVIPKVTLTFTNNVCEVVDNRVTASSLVDVYFTKDTMSIAENAQVYVDSEAGKIVLTAANTPTANMEALIRVRVM